MRTALSIQLTLTLLPAALDAQKKKKKKKPEIEITQTLEVLPDPPASVTVEKIGRASCRERVLQVV